MKLFSILLFFILQNILLGSAHINFTEDEKKYLDSNPIVKIGSIDSYIPFSFVQNDKKIGFTQDLIEIISKKTGIKFHKTGGTWPEIYKKFETGEIDMISEFSYRVDRVAFTNYTNPYYEIPIGVFTRKDFKNYTGIDSLKGQRVGIVKNSYLVDILKQIKEIDLVLIDSSDKRFHYLINNKVDVVLSNAMSLFRVDFLMLQDVKLAGYFKHPDVKSEDLRFGIKKDKVLLASIINKVLDGIDYSTMTMLKNQWVLKDHKNNINLTHAEVDWIKNNEILIGVEEAKPYIYFNESTQNIDGLYADILKIVLKKTGIKSKYVTGEWAELLENFKEKKIDLLPATFYKKSREKFGNFTTDFYKVREYIYAKKDDDTINTFEDIANKKIAIVKNYATIKKLKNKLPSVKIIETKNLEESISLLQTGKVDALIDYHLVVENYIRENFILGLKSVVQNELKPFSVHYFSNIDKPILQSILQRGLDSITREEKNEILKSWLRIPYTIKEKADNLSFQEKQFINNHPIIRFRVRPDRPPFEFESDGKAKGIAVDYIRKSAKNVGLNVEFVIDNAPIKDAFEVVEKQNGKYDTLLFLVKNQERAEKFSFGSEYLSYPLMIITHKNTPYVSSLKDLNNKTIVLEKGFLTNEWISKDYPAVNIVNAASTREALKMVNDEKVIAYVGNLGIANYMSIFEDMNNLKVSAPSNYEDVKYNFVAPREWPELTSLLSKGFKEISAVEHSAINQKWFSLQTIEKTNYTLLFQAVLILSIIIFFITWWNRQLTAEKNRTAKALEKLQQAQINLEEKTKEQLKQQQLLLNQSKIASMGEMMGNIAHQWRQPLSIISTASTGLLMEKEFNKKISDEKFKDTLNTINEHAQYLSQTIDTFRDYINSNKKIQKVILQDSINVGINIVHASYQNNYIKLVSNIENVEKLEINLVSNELSEVIINILNNAKDAIKQNNIQNPCVKIDLKKLEDKVIISIEDNAGGIPEDIIAKIFEPYFTTKHKSQGTGLGLHMSYQIITESLKGNIYAKNSSDGASFFIELPL
jgi:ABC-type amino acid transport substrate-binding protein/nitrogen-specific signal transduction histidine kinase